MQKKIFFILTFFIIIFCFQNAEAQRKIKYKDVYDMVLTGNQQKSYSLLLEYQRQDPEFINTYVQLGQISCNWAKDFDPLTDIEMVELFIYNTKLYFGLAKGKLQKDERDVKKNSDYYLNIEYLKQIEKFEFEDADKYLSEKIEEIKIHEQNIHIIVNNFNKSIEYYKFCTDLYKQINVYNSNLKDMYLYPSADLKVKIEQIIEKYDSAMYFFEEYKNSIKNYPIKEYNQQLNIKKIETYRLDGLSISDFLNNEILIWDYKTWAEELNNQLNNDIKELRKEIENTNSELSKFETSLNENLLFSDDLTPYNLEDKIIFKIEKYDYKSLISSLFLYRNSKIDYIIHSKKTLNNSNDTANYTSELKSKYYYNNILKNIYTDSLLTVLENRITENNIKKYKDFFENNYSGSNNIKNYCNNEKLDLKMIQNSNLKNFKISLFKETLENIAYKKQLVYQNSKIPLYIHTPKFAEDTVKQYYTLNVTKDEKHNLYISGYYKTGNSTQAFLAKSEDETTISWIRTSSLLSDNYDFISCNQPFESGTFCILHSRNKNQEKNSLLEFNEAGIQIQKFDLSEKTIPRILKYDDINEKILIAYDGINYNYSAENSDTITVEKIDIAEQISEWKTKIPINGEVFQIQKIDTTYYLFCNYNKYNDINGNVILSNNKKNIVTIKIAENGTILEFIPLEFNEEIIGFDTYKISSNIFNIVALDKNASEIQNQMELYNSDFYFIIIDKEGKLIFCNE